MFASDKQFNNGGELSSFLKSVIWHLNASHLIFLIIQRNIIITINIQGRLWAHIWIDGRWLRRLRTTWFGCTYWKMWLARFHLIILKNTLYPDVKHTKLRMQPSRTIKCWSYINVIKKQLPALKDWPDQRLHWMRKLVEFVSLLFNSVYFVEPIITD